MTAREFTTHQSLNAARRAAKSPLAEWHSISIVRFEDGASRAWHNHLDLPTRRLVAQQLRDPLGDTVGYPWHVLALLAAAEELEARHRDDHGL